jgi:hypothetical protein
MAGAGVPVEDPDELTEDGHLYLDRYAEGGDEEDLRRALAAYQKALDVLPPGEERWPFLSNLGNCLRIAHEEFRDPQALAVALDVLADASGQVEPGTADYALVADNLALALRDRFAATGEARDLRRAAQLHHAAVAAYLNGPELSRYLNNLGGVYWELYGHTGDPAYLEQATASFEASVAATPPDSPDRARQLSNLAESLADQYRTGADAAFLHRAIGMAAEALTVPGADHTDRARMQSAMGGLLVERFEAEGSRRDLDEAAGLFRAAVTGTDPRATRYAGLLNNLGEVLLVRFEQTGDETDLDEAVVFLERAVRMMSSSASGATRSGDGRFATGLGAALGSRYLLRGDLADLDRAVELIEAAVAAIPDDAAAEFAANRKHNLAELMRRRYEARGDVADLEVATRLLREAVALTPPGSPATVRRQASLGQALRDTYSVTGDFRLVDDAIEGYQRALETVGTDAPRRATYLDHLGMALLDRYERSGSIDDLDESARILRMAMDATTADADAKAGILNNLGVVLWNRHGHRPGSNDLGEALDAFQRAVEATVPDTADAATYLDNLASALSDRYAATGDAADLAQAITAYEQAVAALPDNAPERLRVLSNLAVSLLARYRDARAHEDGDEDDRDLDRALTILLDVTARTPSGAPALVSRLNSLGVGLKYRFQRDRDPADLARGRAALSAASGQAGDHDARWRLAAACTLAGWAAERDEWAQAAAAYPAAMAVAEDYRKVQLARDNAEAAMRGFAGLYAEAAYALARNGQRPEAATAAERGRAVLLSEALDRERALARLLAADSRPEVAALAGRFRQSLAKLRELGGEIQKVHRQERTVTTPTSTPIASW